MKELPLRLVSNEVPSTTRPSLQNHSPEAPWPKGHAAEEEGFEPPDGRPVAGFQNRSFRPLSHSSFEPHGSGQKAPSRTEKDSNLRHPFRRAPDFQPGAFDHSAICP